MAIWHRICSIRRLSFGIAGLRCERDAAELRIRTGSTWDRPSATDVGLRLAVADENVAAFRVVLRYTTIIETDLARNMEAHPGRRGWQRRIGHEPRPSWICEKSKSDDNRSGDVARNCRICLT